MTHVAILYVFHERNEHVDYFLKHGVFTSLQYDFYFIFNGTPDKLPNFPHQVLFRENKGGDFAGWAAQLFNSNFNRSKYDYFLFINSSVTGPFLPSYYHGEWPMIFVSLLSHDVKLSGISINSGVWLFPGVQMPHVQSMIFCVSRETLEFLIEKQIFHPTKIITDKIQLILQCEVRMSTEILKAGGNIACLMNVYREVDFRNRLEKQYGDPWVPGTPLHPYETVFYKNNRGIKYMM